MNKIKWWNKLENWKKGFVIGLLISAVISIINTFLFYGVLGAILFYPINWFLFDLLNLFGLRNCGESCWWILILIGNIEFIIFITLLGAFIGYKYRKIKNG